MTQNDLQISGSTCRAAEVPWWYGWLVGPPGPAGYAASPPRVTPVQREPAPRHSGDDRDRAVTGKLSAPFRAHQWHDEVAGPPTGTHSLCPGYPSPSMVSPSRVLR
jgi:hypothetical protein